MWQIDLESSNIPIPMILTHLTCVSTWHVSSWNPVSLHFRNLYLNRPDPITFIPLTVDTTGHLYDDFIRLFFLHAHREASVLTNELSGVPESDQFRFLRTVCFANLKGTVGLIMVKASTIRISIPLDLSSRSFMPLPRFIRSCRPTPFLTPSLVLFPPCSV